MRVRATAATAVIATAITAALPLAGPVAAQSPAPSTGPAAGPAAGGTILTLLHNNDGESSLLPISYLVGDTGPRLQVGGIAAFASVLGREIADAHTNGHSVLTVYAGDSYLASPTLACSLPPASPDTPIYDAVAQAQLPYDVHVFGNHEFDYGPDFLLRYVQGFKEGKQLTQPFLSANLDFSGEKDWRSLIVKNGLIDGSPKGGRVVARSAIVKDPVTGERFGVVGATTPDLPVVASPGKVKVTADLASTAKKVQKEVDRLTKAGIDKVILVSHLQSVANDQELVALLKNVDAVVAGGGDELLVSDTVPQDAQLLPGERADIAGSYPLQAPDATGRDVPIVTTAGNYKYLGRLDLRFDDQGNVTEVLPDTSYPRRIIDENQDGSQIADLGITDAVPPTQDLIYSVTDPVTACIDAQKATTIIRSEVPLNVARGQAEPFALGVRSAETNAGDLVADSFLYAYDSYGQTSKLPLRDAKNPVIAVQNGGGIRQSAGDVLPAGTLPGSITRFESLSVLPFDDFLVSVDEVTAADLVAVLDQSCANVGGGGFLQVSAVSFTCDLTRPTGSQAVSVTFTNATADPSDDLIVADAEGTVGDVGPFRIVTNQFTANGGDGYATLAALPHTRMIDTQGLPVGYEQAFREYLVTFPLGPEGTTLPATDQRYADPAGEGRITIIRPAPVTASPSPVAASPAASAAPVASPAPSASPAA
ncbi:MAG: 5'-nucleotidase C-terminal domain-containing protein [Chloroflexota bacterium]